MIKMIDTCWPRQAWAGCWTCILRQRLCLFPPLTLTCKLCNYIPTPCPGPPAGAESAHGGWRRAHHVCWGQLRHAQAAAGPQGRRQRARFGREEAIEDVFHVNVAPIVTHNASACPLSLANDSKIFKVITVGPGRAGSAVAGGGEGV